MGILLSIFGYLSGGILTGILLFWNGYLLGMIYNLGWEYLGVYELCYLSKHIPFEIYGLLLFSNIGFSGFFFYRKLLLQQKIEINTFEEIKKMIKPSLLLFISAIIEIL